MRLWPEPSGGCAARAQTAPAQRQLQLHLSFSCLADAARSCLRQGEGCQGLLGVWCSPRAGCGAEAGEPMGPSPNFHLRPHCSTHGSQMWEAVASMRSVPVVRFGRSPNLREKHSWGEWLLLAGCSEVENFRLHVPSTWENGENPLGLCNSHHESWKTAGC